jgi:hypothetical protein
MDSHRNQCFSKYSTRFPQNSWYQVRDPVVCVSIVELIGITKINQNDLGFNITLEISTLPLLLLIKFAELELHA